MDTLEAFASCTHVETSCLIKEQSVVVVVLVPSTTNVFARKAIRMDIGKVVFVESVYQIMRLFKRVVKHKFVTILQHAIKYFNTVEGHFHILMSRSRRGCYYIQTTFVVLTFLLFVKSLV